MKKSTSLITVILIISLMAGSAFAWGHGKGRNESGNCMGYAGQNADINLTQEQKDQLSALRQAFIDDTYETRAAKFSTRHEMKMLMETSNPDRAKLIQLSDELLTLEKELRDKKIDFGLKVKEIAPELTGFNGRGPGKGCGKMGMRGGCKKGPAKKCGMEPESDTL